MAHIGHYISGAGHVGLIGFLFVGPVFTSEPLPFETVDVSVVSAEEFAALTAPRETVAQPDAPQTPAAPEVPEPDVEAPPARPTAEDPPESAPTPAPPQPPAQEAAVPSPPAPPAPVEAPQTDAPALVTPEALDVPDAPEVAEESRQRPSERIAPNPVAPPAPEADIAPETRQAVAPDPTEVPAEEETPPQDATAPQEAASEIVTEAEEGRPAAPERSQRPQARPSRIAAPAQEPDTTPAPEAPPDPVTRTAEAVEDALMQALAGGETAAEAPAAPAAPAGPPLTSGEREGLVIAVQECWVIDPGSPASEVVVTVAVSLSQEGRVQGDVRRVSAQGGDARAQDVAFQAARRAVLRCQAGGFPLPPEKYAQWQEVEMTFNPEFMRIR